MYTEKDWLETCVNYHRLFEDL